jgi:hypothetical protein
MRFRSPLLSPVLCPHTTPPPGSSRVAAEAHMMNQPSLLHQPRMAPICHHGFTAVIVRARLSSLGPESHRQASRLTIASQESVEATTAEEVREHEGPAASRWLGGATTWTTTALARCQLFMGHGLALKIWLTKSEAERDGVMGLR